MIRRFFGLAVAAVAIAAAGAQASDEKPLVSKSDTPWVGIYFDTVTPRGADKLKYPHETGIIVSMVIPGSPAERDGIREGDIIYSFDGAVVKDAGHFGTLVKERRPNDSVTLVVFRKGNDKKIELRLGDQADRSVHFQEFGRSGEEAQKLLEEAYILKKGFPVQSFFTRGRIGVLLYDPDDDLAAYFDVEKGAGALVLDVEAGSAAEKAGIRSGDVIVRVGGDPVADVSAAIEAVSSAGPGDTLAIEVLRKGARKSVAVAVEPQAGGPFRVLPSGKGALDAFEMEKIRSLRTDDPDKLRRELEALKEQVRDLEERLKARKTE